MVTGSMCSSYKCADDILEFRSLFSIHFRASQFEQKFGCSLVDFKQKILHSKHSHKLCIPKLLLSNPSAFL